MLKQYLEIDVFNWKCVFMKRCIITLYVCLKNAHVETTFSILKIIYIHIYIYNF